MDAYSQKVDTISIEELRIVELEWVDLGADDQGVNPSTRVPIRMAPPS